MGPVHFRHVAMPVEKLLKTLRRELRTEGFEVVEELDFPRAQLAVEGDRCVVLLVDCPLLFFEAVALDRAAAAFFPMHIVVSADEAGSRIQWAHPGAVVNARLPTPVRRPIDALFQRLSRLLEGAVPFGTTP